MKYTEKFKKEVEERKNIMQEEAKKEKEAKKEEETKREEALKEIPEMIDLLRRVKIQLGGNAGFDSREYKETEETYKKIVKNYEDILGEKRFLKDVYKIKTEVKNENK